MKIKQPLCITSKLQPGVRIGGAEISIDYSLYWPDGWPDGRQYYNWSIGLQNGQEFEGDDISSGAGGGGLQKCLESLLGFLGAFAEAHRTHNSENSELFPIGLAKWAVDNADEINMLACELEEKPGEFIIE